MNSQNPFISDFSIDDPLKQEQPFPMQESLVLTVLGPDRTGIVESLSSTVTKHGGSWQESQMARLAGQFAGIIRVTCSHEDTPALKTALESLTTSNLAISIAQEPQGAYSEQRTRYSLDVLGNDRPGILSEVSQVLRTQNANIIEIETRIESAPETGHGIFHTIATITLDNQSEPTPLTQALEDLSPDLQVSLS